MTYSQYVRETMKEQISLYGSVRKASEHIGVNSAVISKIINGKYIPKIKTFSKWFPDVLTHKFDEELILYKQECKIEIHCDELEELKFNLDRLGYEIIIQKKS